MSQPLTIHLNGDDIAALCWTMAKDGQPYPVLKQTVEWHLQSILRKVHRAWAKHALQTRRWTMGEEFRLNFHLIALGKDDLVFKYKDGRIMRIPRP